MKRNEIIELMRKAGCNIKNLVGMAAMQGNSYDATCKDRHHVLELKQNLQSIEQIYDIKLYQEDSVNVIMGWVPIPMPNSQIKQAIEDTYGEVKHIYSKRDKDGLLTGIRI